MQGRQNEILQRIISIDYNQLVTANAIMSKPNPSKEDFEKIPQNIRDIIKNLSTINTTEIKNKNEKIIEPLVSPDAAARLMVFIGWAGKYNNSEKADHFETDSMQQFLDYFEDEYKKLNNIEIPIMKAQFDQSHQALLKSIQCVEKIPQTKKILEIFYQLKNELSKNQSDKIYTIEEISQAFLRIKQNVFPDTLSEDEYNEIIKLQYLFNQQLNSSRIKNKSKLVFKDINGALCRAGYLYANNLTEGDIRLAYLKALRLNSSDESKIEKSIQGREIISQSRNVSLRSMQSYFQDGQLKEDLSLCIIDKELIEKIKIDTKRSHKIGIVFGRREENDNTPITRQDIIVNSVVDASYADVMNGLPVLRTLHAVYGEIKNESIKDFFDSITHPEILENFCIDTFKDLTYGSPMELKDPVNGYTLLDGFTQSLSASIDHVFEETSYTQTMTREELMKLADKEVNNLELNQEITADKFVAYGRGGYEQLKMDYTRDYLVMGSAHDEASSRLKNDSDIQQRISNAHSQPPTYLISSLIKGSLNILDDQVKIFHPKSKIEVVSDIIPSQPDLDTYYLVYSNHEWKLIYIDYYGKQNHIEINEVENLRDFLTEKTSGWISENTNFNQLNVYDLNNLKNIIEPYRDQHHIKPLKKFNYVKDNQGEIYLMCDYKLFPIVDTNNLQILGCLGSASAKFKCVGNSLELVDIQTDEPYIVQALKTGNKFSKDEVLSYCHLHQARHRLQEAIKEKRVSGDVNHRVLIDAENGLKKAGKTCCDTQLSTEYLAELSRYLDETTKIVEESSSISQKMAPNINETELLLSLDTIVQIKNFGERHSGHGGIAKMIDTSNSKSFTVKEKWDAIVKESKYRTSRLSSMGGFTKNSILHQLSPRTDAVDLLYRAIAEKDSNLDFNPEICTLEQLLIAQQKREAIVIFEKEINRLSFPHVGTGLFGGGGRVSDISFAANLKIAAYEELIALVGKSNHTISLTTLLESIFEKETTSIAKCLFASRGILPATSASVINNLRSNIIDLKSVFQGRLPSMPSKS